MPTLTVLYWGLVLLAPATLVALYHTVKWCVAHPKAFLNNAKEIGFWGLAAITVVGFCMVFVGGIVYAARTECITSLTDDGISQSEAIKNCH